MCESEEGPVWPQGLAGPALRSWEHLPKKQSRLGPCCPEVSLPGLPSPIPAGALQQGRGPVDDPPTQGNPQASNGSLVLGTGLCRWHLLPGTTPPPPEGTQPHSLVSQHHPVLSWFTTRTSTQPCSSAPIVLTRRLRSGVRIDLHQRRCCNKTPQTEGLRNNGHLFLTVLQAGSSRSRRQQVKWLVGAPSLVHRWRLLTGQKGQGGGRSGVSL